MVTTENNDIYRAFYTKSAPIVSYMIGKLSVDNGMRVLEPCAGDGVFIDALNSLHLGMLIDAFELNPEAVGTLRTKYLSHQNVNVILDNTLTSPQLDISNGMYDRVIANPPYGGWLDYDERKRLKKIYPALYIKETYTLFLYRCVKLLKDKGILVFIVPDTFLNLHMHTRLREFLLTNTKIQEISLFPSSFFPKVNFGYSNLCIITLEKSLNPGECLSNRVKVFSGFKNVSELAELGKETRNQRKSIVLNQSNIYSNIDHALFVSENTAIVSLVTDHPTRLGDIAHCVTGFYSGNDKKYLYTASKDVKNAKRYNTVDKSLVCNECAYSDVILDGVNDSKHFVPIVKGGGIKYYKPDLWFMDWSVEAVRDYKTNRKARFQNSQYYFKLGIGAPMISSSQITAALIEKRLFDQSIVGIFPKDNKWLYYLLGLFNSPTCNRLIRTINPSANNPANYIKKIPFIFPSDKVLQNITEAVKAIVISLKEGNEYPKNLEESVNTLIQQTYGF